MFSLLQIAFLVTPEEIQSLKITNKLVQQIQVRVLSLSSYSSSSSSSSSSSFSFSSSSSSTSSSFSPPPPPPLNGFLARTSSACAGTQ